MAAEGRPCLDDLVFGVVQRDYVSAAPSALEDVAAEAGPDVEDSVTGREAEFVELDRQHVAVRPI